MCELTNLEVLIFVLGWQGGTLEQVAKALCIQQQTILEANAEQMQKLCRRAQIYRTFKEHG